MGFTDGIKRFFRVEQRRNQAAIFDAYQRTGLRWLDFGDNNLYPQELAKLTNSPTHFSILNTKAAMAYGGGPVYADADSASGAEAKFQQVCGGNEQPFLRRLLRDIIIYGGISVQVDFATDGSILKLTALDFKTVRLESPMLHKDLTPRSVYMSPDWANYSRNGLRPEEVPLFTTPRTQNQPSAVHYAVVPSDITPFYPAPDYMGAINWINCEIEIANFHYNNIRNGFRPDFILTLPDTIPQAERPKFVEEFSQQYSGTDRAGGVIVAFGAVDRKTGTYWAPTVTPMPQSANADMYLVTMDQAIQSIITAHRLPSPTIAGLAGAGGLGGNASEIATAFDYFYSTVIRDYIRILNELLWPVLSRLGFTQEIGFISPTPSYLTAQEPTETPLERYE